MGCCTDENKCGQCPEGQKGTCKKDADCQKQNFDNSKNFKLNQKTGGFIGRFTATGEFISEESNNESNPLSNWIHQEGKIVDGKPVKEGPVYIFNKIVEKYGNPDVMINKEKGICIWYIQNKNGDPHHSIELKDEYVSHCVPAQHYDFLYSYIKIYIPPEKIKQVLSVSGSVGHFNPIITFVNYLNKTVTLKVFLIYLCAQVAGGLAALNFPKLK